MTFDTHKFRSALKKIVDAPKVVSTFHDCTVISINQDNRTCVVTSCDGSQEIDNLAAEFDKIK